MLSPIPLGFAGTYARNNDNEASALARCIPLRTQSAANTKPEQCGFPLSQCSNAMAANQTESRRLRIPMPEQRTKPGASTPLDTMPPHTRVICSVLWPLAISWTVFGEGPVLEDFLS